MTTQLIEKEICIVPGCNKPRDKKQNRRICPLHRSRLNNYKSYQIPPKAPLPLGIVKICKKHGPLKTEQTKKRYKGKEWLSCNFCLMECEKRFIDKVGAKHRNELKKNYYISCRDSKKPKLKLSKKEYEKMLNEQNNVCAICKKPETAKKRGKTLRLAIDHCHDTDKIRGLLCLNCNSWLARSAAFQATEAAINYLSKT